jgi:hypothetical protein
MAEFLGIRPERGPTSRWGVPPDQRVKRPCGFWISVGGRLTVEDATPSLFEQRLALAKRIARHAAPVQVKVSPGSGTAPAHTIGRKENRGSGSDGRHLAAAGINGLAWRCLQESPRQTCRFADGQWVFGKGPRCGTCSQSNLSLKLVS